MMLDVAKSPLSVIFNLTSVDVVEETIDGEISSKRIIKRCSDLLHGKICTMVGILDSLL
jgi:hypothetical protein